MAKYIDADILREKLIERLGLFEGLSSDTISPIRIDECKKIIGIIDSLQQELPDEVLIPKWCLENIENTLRIQHNINNDAKDGETCQDRNIKESLNCVRKLLNGEEITGRERSEPLKKQPEVDLEKEIEKYYYDNFAFISSAHTPTKDIVSDIANHFYELGQKDAANKYDAGFKAGSRWLAEQGVSVEANIMDSSGSGYLSLIMPNNINNRYKFFNDGDRVIVQIRKKEESK